MSSLKTLITRFGTWGRYVESCGFKVNPFGEGRSKGYSKQILIKALREASRRNKSNILSAKFLDTKMCNDLPGKNTIILFFGTWSNAKKAAKIL